VRKQRVGGPVTLWEAHQFLMACRPLLSAKPQVWVKYYRESAALYAEMAELDRGHHHESLYWASRERQKADELDAQIRAGKPVTDTVKAGEAPDYT